MMLRRVAKKTRLVRSLLNGGVPFLRCHGHMGGYPEDQFPVTGAMAAWEGG